MFYWVLQVQGPDWRLIKPGLSFVRIVFSLRSESLVGSLDYAGQLSLGSLWKPPCETEAAETKLSLCVHLYTCPRFKPELLH